jgi:exodeoxyribonuclease VII large subunit
VINISNIYTVGQLNAYIKNMFTQDYLLQSLSVKGEVSNCKYHTSGHIYFTLKDSKGSISCIMFAGKRRGLAFELADGMQVTVSGTVDVYERDGKYQLYAEKITAEGAGLLYERMEALKRELEELGMFAMEYKQPIPKYINTLGVVTADTGAAVRDIIQIAQRRNPYVQIILYPAIVQGEAAADSIVKGIKALEKYGVDVMIVGRGGGSIEDLWAFNERKVAQAVFDCKVPVISAVGHQTDTTIIDFVSDMRAPTPSAAAELAVSDIRDITGNMIEYRNKLERAMQQKIKSCREESRYFAMKLKVKSPEGQLREKKQYAIQIEDRLNADMQTIINQKRQELAIYIEKMKGLSPIEKLNSGFSYVRNEEGLNVRSVETIKPGDLLSIHVKDGIIDARTEKITGLSQFPG